MTSYMYSFICVVLNCILLDICVITFCVYVHSIGDSCGTLSLSSTVNNYCQMICLIYEQQIIYLIN